MRRNEDRVKDNKFFIFIENISLLTSQTDQKVSSLPTEITAEGYGPWYGPFDSMEAAATFRVTKIDPLIRVEYRHTRSQLPASPADIKDFTGAYVVEMDMRKQNASVTDALRRVYLINAKVDRDLEMFCNSSEKYAALKSQSAESEDGAHMHKVVVDALREKLKYLVLTADEVKVAIPAHHDRAPSPAETSGKRSGLSSLFNLKPKSKSAPEKTATPGKIEDNDLRFNRGQYLSDCLHEMVDQAVKSSTSPSKNRRK